MLAAGGVHVTGTGIRAVGGNGPSGLRRPRGGARQLGATGGATAPGTAPPPVAGETRPGELTLLRTVVSRPASGRAGALRPADREQARSHGGRDRDADGSFDHARGPRRLRRRHVVDRTLAERAVRRVA